MMTTSTAEEAGAERKKRWGQRKRPGAATSTTTKTTLLLLTLLAVQRARPASSSLRPPPPPLPLPARSSSSSSYVPAANNAGGRDDEDDDGGVTFTDASESAPIATAAGTTTAPTTTATHNEGGLLWKDLYVAVRGNYDGRTRRGGGRSRNDAVKTTITTSTTSTSKVLLDGVSGNIRDGRVCGLIGPSGSGKTTFLSTLLLGTTTGDISSAMAAASGWVESGEVWKFRRRESQRTDDAETSTEDATVGGNSTAEDGPLELVLNPLHRSQVAFLNQQENFFELLTVEETLRTAAFFELPHLVEAERNRMVHGLLEGLGLAHVAHHRIGSPRSKQDQFLTQDAKATRTTRRRLAQGFQKLLQYTHLPDGIRRKLVEPFTSSSSGGCLSGGERRRLAVALELVTEKQVLLADEPTSGLDSAKSLQVMRMIRDLARSKNIPCLVSLHQPQSVVWNEFLDDCIVMAPGGRFVYVGPVAQVPAYLESVGYPVSPATNPAEFLIDLVTVDTENTEQATIDEQRIDYLVKEFHKYQSHETRPVTVLFDQHEKETEMSLTHAKEDVRFKFSLSFHVESFERQTVPRFAALVRRSWRQNVRNRTTNAARLVGYVAGAYLVAQIYPTVRGRRVFDNSLADRCAILIASMSLLGVMAYMKSADLFCRERPVVLREQLRNQYSAVEYVLSKVVAELPLDAIFAAVFSTVLKLSAGLKITWFKLTTSLALMTACIASMVSTQHSVLLTNLSPSGLRLTLCYSPSPVL